MKKIKLGGKWGFFRVALVDDDDFERISKYKWRVRMRGENAYAITGTGQYMHRMIIDPPDGMQVDHINGNGLDNTRQNLRICTHAENMRNQRKRKRKNTGSYFIGVTRYGKYKWQANIQYKGKRYRLGVFDTQLEAAQARDRKAIEFNDEFICLNFPPQRQTPTSDPA